MKKNEIVERLQEYCDASSYSSGGYADRPFYIHMKKSDSFHVRKGNYLEWDDDDCLTIIFTKEFNAPGQKPKGDSQEAGFWNTVFEIGGKVLDVYAQAQMKEKERESAKRKKIKWYWIEKV